jgi:hypothetical protein
MAEALEGTLGHKSRALGKEKQFRVEVQGEVQDS